MAFLEKAARSGRQTYNYPATRIIIGAVSTRLNVAVLTFLAEQQEFRKSFTRKRPLQVARRTRIYFLRFSRSTVYCRGASRA
jgi:hypothetical protein